MSYDAREVSASSGQPFELYLFQTELQSWYFTSSDKKRTFQGHTYSPDGLSRTSITQSTEAKGGHVKVTVPKDNDIAKLFVGYIPSTPLYLTIYRNHEGEVETEARAIFVGRVLSGDFTKSDTCELDCAPDSELLKRRIVAACFQKPCNRILFDEGCAVNKLTFRAQGVLTSVSADGLTIKADAFATKPNGWWATGYIEVGADKRMVIAHAGDTLTLMNPLNGLGVGASVYVYAGCDRTYATCQAKFTNGVNFLGWEWMPTKNPFSSGVA